MHEICIKNSNMLKYENYMHKYAIGKYAQICTNIMMLKYAKNMQEICKYMQGLRLVLFCENMQEICKKYARICRIFKQGYYMQ